MSFKPLLKVNQATRYPKALGFLIVGQRNESLPKYSRKEVIQPQVLLRLPCYDFTPVAASAVDGNQFSIPA